MTLAGTGFGSIRRLVGRRFESCIAYFLKPLKRISMGMTKDDFFVPENRIADKREEIESPSGQYKLIVDHYRTGKGSWNFTQGTVLNQAGDVITVVRRNYSFFWHAWVEDHPDGHDYLLCGENCQGQTVIQLDTGERRDHLEAAAGKGYGFCWADVHPSPDKTILAAHGCYWACPYEVFFYDFTNPMGDMVILQQYRDGLYDVRGWETDDKFIVYEEVEVRKSDGKPIDDIPQEEWPEDDDDWDEVETPITINMLSPEERVRVLIKDWFLWRLEPERHSPTRPKDAWENVELLLKRLPPEVADEIKRESRWDELTALPFAEY